METDDIELMQDYQVDSCRMYHTRMGGLYQDGWDILGWAGCTGMGGMYRDGWDVPGWVG